LRMSTVRPTDRQAILLRMIVLGFLMVAPRAVAAVDGSDGTAIIGAPEVGARNEDEEGTAGTGALSVHETGHRTLD
jgi:hypothetical protein